MCKVLVIDDSPFCRDMVSKMLRHAGHEAIVASSASEGIDALACHTVDLVILDNEMPGTSGLDFLKQLRGSGMWDNMPVIMLTGSTERDTIIAAKRFGVAEYLLKSNLAVDTLVARVRKGIDGRNAKPAGMRNAKTAAGDGPAGAGGNHGATPSPADPNHKAGQLLTREESLERVERAFDMKTMPGVVMEVISQAASPRTDSASLTALIGRDSMLAAQVLQVANSAAYASSRGMVSTISEAVRNIGCGTVRNIAASLGVFDVMPAGQPDGTFNPVRYWQHSLAVAVLSERLATLGDACPPGIAYLVGLCHDLGGMLFQTTFAAEYAQVLESQARTGTKLEAIERTMLGVTHHEIAGLILRKLGLPESIRKPIEAMSSPSHEKADPAARILLLADAYANGLMLCESSVAQVALATKADCRTATGQDDPPSPDPLAFRGEIVALTTILARLSTAQARELSQPLLPRSQARVWLMRDRALSSYDAVGAALATMAEVRVSNRLPEAGEAADFDRVVVTAPSTSAGVLAQLEQLSSTMDPAAVLWLVQKIDAAIPASALVQPRSDPLSLRELGNFLLASKGELRIASAAA